MNIFCFRKKTNALRNHSLNKKPMLRKRSMKEYSLGKPLMSISIFLSFLFLMTFIKMENRQMGYSFIKLAQKEKHMRAHQQTKSLTLAKMVRPERVQYLATQELPLKKAKPQQIIQMREKGLVFVQ